MVEYKLKILDEVIDEFLDLPPKVRDKTLSALDEICQDPSLATPCPKLHLGTHYTEIEKHTFQLRIYKYKKEILMIDFHDSDFFNRLLNPVH